MSCTSVSRFRRRRGESNHAARQADHLQRCQILARLEESVAAGLSRAAALRCAAISPGTWRNWQRWQQAGQPRLAPRGRPPRCATQGQRQLAIDFLVEHGAGVPLHALRAHVPDVPRAELADLRQRYQRICRWRRDRFRGRLLWKHVGAVWSMDFTEPKEFIGGTDRWILAIRDLASGYQLTWLSSAQATAQGVIEVLVALFVEHGPPLVLKSDNGSQFIAAAMISLLWQWRVEPLFNPPRRPAYNGGLERTHPILKGYTLAAAAAQGRPAGAMPEDLATAQTNANRFTRRLGDDGPTAEEAWRDRRPISEELRLAFRLTVAAHRPAARAARGLDDVAELNHYQQAAVDRDAIRDALLAHGLLEIRPYRGTSRLPRRVEAAPLTPDVSAPARLPACTTPEVLPGVSPSVVDAATSNEHVADDASAMLAPSAPRAPEPTCEHEESQESCLPMARMLPESCRIVTAPVEWSCVQHATTRAGPARGEPAPTSTLRRLITPLITWLRRAMIR